MRIRSNPACIIQYCQYLGPQDRALSFQSGKPFRSPSMLAPSVNSTTPRPTSDCANIANLLPNSRMWR